jgi:hypothetical protein
MPLILCAGLSSRAQPSRSDASKAIAPSTALVDDRLYVYEAVGMLLGQVWKIALFGTLLFYSYFIHTCCGTGEGVVGVRWWTTGCTCTRRSGCCWAGFGI